MFWNWNNLVLYILLFFFVKKSFIFGSYSLAELLAVSLLWWSASVLLYASSSWIGLMGTFICTIWSSCPYNSSVVLSTCHGQSITDRIPADCFFPKWVLNHLEQCLGSLFYCKMKFAPIKHHPHMAWVTWKRDRYPSLDKTDAVQHLFSCSQMVFSVMPTPQTLIYLSMTLFPQSSSI